MKTFNVIHHDGVVKVRIHDDGRAILEVDEIKDHHVVVKAINRAFREGALFGSQGQLQLKCCRRIHLRLEVIVKAAIMAEQIT